MVRNSLDENIRSDLKAALLAMHTGPRGRRALKKLGILRFVDADTHATYQSVMDLARRAGLDLKTYDYHKP